MWSSVYLIDMNEVMEVTFDVNMDGVGETQSHVHVLCLQAIQCSFIK